MNDKKNIDRLFQEKFKDFEIAPNDAMWDRISESLPNKKKKRRVIALWWQMAGVAAVLTLLITVGVSEFSSINNNEILPVVDTDKIDSNQNNREDQLKTSGDANANEFKAERDQIKVADSNENTEGLSQEKEKEKNAQKSPVSNALKTPQNYQKNSTTIANQTDAKEKVSAVQSHSSLNNTSINTGTDKVAVKSTSTTSTSEESNAATLTSDTEMKSAVKKTINNNKTAVAEQSSSNTSVSSTSGTDETIENTLENKLTEDPNKLSIEEAIAQQTDTDPINEEEKDNPSRWSIAPNVAPVYYSSLGEGSSLDMQFNENTKSSNINMSYGIAGAYAISKKVKVRAGINRVNLSQTTTDVFAFTGAETAARGVEAEFGNISFKNGTDHVTLMSSKMMNNSSVPELFNTKVAGDINQEFGFIEVPLEIEYRLLDTKFGVNVIGGFSTFFLSQNDIYADIDGVSTLIGEANNISNTSFSANFGLGMDYNLSRQWNINLEPTFKYQINTFNNTSGNFRPFFIGVYTGLSFKF